MSDVFTKTYRSFLMSNIRSKDTKPEMEVRTFLFSKGFRYKLHENKLPGKPDIVMKKFNTIIFINGCFWHGHMKKQCNIFRQPKSNKKFWSQKITYNQRRDLLNKRKLRRLGWRIITIWECDLRSKSKDIVLTKLVDKILS